ncbi:MAG TPA: DUF4912 domain-containing protein [Candidatus Saccharimonadales bacterium]|nr:DUF4912 domain-containing protein [Candidatus Saccharimonadales bacterium]
MKSDSTKKKNSPKNVAPQGADKPKKAALKIPPILLEGDAPAEAQPGGPGKRYALGPEPQQAKTEPLAEKVAELPESYGTKRLILTARDPHWIYAHWDLTREQQKEYNALSVDKHLVIRVYKNMVAGKPFSEVHVHPESRNWFLNVGDGGTKYIAELGYYQRNGKWVAVSTSGATLTPPDTMSEDITAWFETLPADLQYQELLALVKQAASENVPLMEAIQQLRSDGHKHLPSPEIIASRVWTPAQEKALSELISMDSVRRVWMGSLEITELIRRQWQQELSSAAAAQFSQPVPNELGMLGSLSSISSPFGGLPRRKFWFNVNAELIIYGATEPDAEVSIGGRIIKLRSDGTFSYRFSLPDGRYELPAVAVSSDKYEQRSAALRFTRGTEYQGEVGKHPQDPGLKIPAAANVE